MRWYRVVLQIAFAAPLASISLAQDRTAAGQPSIANDELTRDVWNTLKFWDGATNKAPAGCSDSLELGARTIVEPPKKGDASKHPWSEEWSVSRCGQESVYRIDFTPKKGGTMFGVSRKEK
jgi:hypothetical protein